MSLRFHPGLIAVAVCSALVASAASAQMPSKEDMRVISANEMKRYVGALDKLIELGLGTEKRFDKRGEGMGMAGAQRAVQHYTDEMQAVIDKQGFTEESFFEVHINAMLAWTALELEKQKPEMEKARAQQTAQMKEMKAQLPPEQYEQMMKAMGSMGMMTTLYDDVPAQNIELVRGYESQIKQILDGAR